MKNDLYTHTRGVWDLQRSPPSWTRGYWSIFWFSDSWGLFTWNISCGKNIVHRGLQGGHQSGAAKIFFERCLQKNFNCGQDTNDKDIFFVKQISDNLKNTHGQNYLVAYVRLPITPPYKRPWFRQFFGFSGKTRDNFLYYFLIWCTTCSGYFLQFFPGGSQIIFH